MTQKLVLRMWPRKMKDEKRCEALRRIYGDDIEVVDVYGANDGDCDRAYAEEINEIIRFAQGEGEYEGVENPRPVLAVELPIGLMYLMQYLRERKEAGIAFIRAVPEGSETGEIITEIDHYEEILEIKFETKRLG